MTGKKGTLTLHRYAPNLQNRLLVADFPVSNIRSVHNETPELSTLPGLYICKPTTIADCTYFCR